MKPPASTRPPGRSGCRSAWRSPARSCWPTLAFSFTNLAESSTVLTPEQQQDAAAALEEDAEVMTNTALDALIVNQPPDVEAEMIRINTEARPFALQVALLIPIFASLLGLFVSFRMMRQPDPVSSGVEGLVLG